MRSKRQYEAGIAPVLQEQGARFVWRGSYDGFVLGAGAPSFVHGFQEAYALDTGYRTAHHSLEFMPPDKAEMLPVVMEDMQDGEQMVVLEDNGLRVLAFNVDHSPVKPAVGYRFEYLGRSVKRE
jgi:hypothetical protein